MGQISGGGETRDNANESMAEGEQSDEVVTELKDVPDITEMEDGVNDSKMEVFENSTKNGHKPEVR